MHLVNILQLEIWKNVLGLLPKSSADCFTRFARLFPDTLLQGKSFFFFKSLFRTLIYLNKAVVSSENNMQSLDICGVKKKEVIKLNTVGHNNNYIHF